VTIEEKAKKYEEIRDWLWGGAVDGNTLQSAICSRLIVHLQIEGPNGEAPEDA
jgi:hypothetical protein